jgi:penicillin-binding protein 1A
VACQLRGMAKPEHSRRAAAEPWPTVRRGGVWGTAARAVIALLGLGAGLGALGAIAVYASFSGELSRPEWRERLRSFDDMVAVGVTRFEASDHSLVGETFSERRLAVRWEEIPQKLIRAFLAVEDARFFEHEGIDLRGVARAMVVNLLAGSMREGASTITQQLAKTLVGSHKSLSRKVLEAILARRMESRYTKQQILTWYLNAIYLGHGSYGVKAAAQNYFRKPLEALTLREMATLAGLPQAPGKVNPWLDPEGSAKRTLHVLTKLEEQGWASQAETALARAEELVVHPLRDPLRDQAPAYTETVRRRGSEMFGADWQTSSGLTVTLGLDPATQRTAETTLATHLEALQARQGFRGPLGNLDAATFLTRNASHAEERLATSPVGARVLGRVDAVTRDAATLSLSPRLKATLSLADAAWAGPFTEQPLDAAGKRVRTARVSFDVKLKDLTAALAVGDVVLVEIQAPEAPKPARKAPRRKKQAEPEPAEPAAAAQAGASTPYRAVLVPIPTVEGALVTLAPDGQTVDAMAGGSDFDRSEVNRAFSLRQLGSLMKPVIYGLAYELGLAPSALLSGAPYREGRYNPTGQRAADDMTVWDGLVMSENSVSLRVHRYTLDRASPEVYRAWGTALGLSRPLEGHRSEVLGMDQTIWDALKAYGSFASSGLRVSPQMVQKAVTRDGRVVSRALHPVGVHASTHDTLLGLWDRVVTPPARMLSRSTAFLVARNMTEVVDRGTGREARKLPFDTAGKTGTLDYDVWFAGFSDRRAAVVWMGDDRRSRTLGPTERDNRVYGATGPLPAWVSFMSAVDGTPDEVKRGKPAGDMPPDVAMLSIDPETGLLAANCKTPPPPRPDGTTPPKPRSMPHRVGTGPVDSAPCPEELHDISTTEDNF